MSRTMAPAASHLTIVPMPGSSGRQDGASPDARARIRSARAAALLSDGAAPSGALRFLKPESRLRDCIAQACPLASAYAETLALGGW